MLTIICRYGEDEVFDESTMVLPAAVELSLFDVSQYSFPLPSTVPPSTSTPVNADMSAGVDSSGC